MENNNTPNNQEVINNNQTTNNNWSINTDWIIYVLVWFFLGTFWIHRFISGKIWSWV